MKKLLLALLLLVPVALPAYADDALDAAKAAGQVGEKPDGLLGSVKPGAEALVKDINSKRLQKFNEIAKQNGQPLATVQAVAGADFIKRTAPGNYVMDAGGKWVKK